MSVHVLFSQSPKLWTDIKEFYGIGDDFPAHTLMWSTTSRKEQEQRFDYVCMLLKACIYRYIIGDDFRAFVCRRRLEENVCGQCGERIEVICICMNWNACMCICMD